MRKYLVLLITFTMLLISCDKKITVDISSGESNPSLSETISIEGYQIPLTWNDEFDILDTETQWELADGPRRGGFWRPQAVTVGDGYMRISTYYDKVTDSYIDGSASTQRKDFLYGYYSARIRFTKGKGHWGAFWIWNWPYEIDIVEKPYTGDEVHHALHWYSPIIEKDHDDLAIDIASKGVDNGWHVYSVLWLPDRYIFYVDGVKTWEIDETEVDIADVPGELILSDEINTGFPGWLGVGYIKNNKNLPDTMDIDWVRAYELNL